MDYSSWTHCVVHTPFVDHGVYYVANGDGTITVHPDSYIGDDFTVNDLSEIINFVPGGLA